MHQIFFCQYEFCNKFSQNFPATKVSLHTVYFIVKIVDCNLQGTEVFLKNWHVSCMGLYRSTSIQQVMCTCRLFYTNSKERYEMHV